MDAVFGSYPTNLVPLGPSCSTGLTRLSPSLRAGSFLGRCSLLRSQNNQTHIEHTQGHRQDIPGIYIIVFLHVEVPQHIELT